MSDGGTKTTTDPKTPEEQVSKANRQAARYRTQRNAALRRAHAMETMLKAHNISLEAMTEARLSEMPIHGGKVDGEFGYKAPRPQQPTSTRVAQPASGGSNVLTADDLAGMSTSQINARWDEVKELLKRS